MTELPKGWAIAELAGLASAGPHSLAIGPFGSNLKVSDYRDVGVPLVFVRNIRARNFGLKPTFVSAEKAAKLAPHRVDPGDVVITKMGDPPGDTAIYPDARPSAILTADCIKLTPHPEISGEFVAFGIESPWCAMQIAEMTGGVAQQKVSLEKFRRLQVPVAPRREQERIVTAIEEAFSKLGAGEAGLRSVRQLLNRMRDAILTAAVTGRLVPQDPTDTPAAKLLADLGVQPLEIEGARALPSGWAWGRLGDLSLSVRNGVFVSRPTESPPGVPILRIGAVRRLALDWSDVRYAPVDIEDPAIARGLLTEGDLLFTRYNGNPAFVGACALVRGVPGPVLHPDKLIRVAINRRAAEPAYVAVAASAGRSREFISSVTKTTAGQAGISGGELKQVPVPLAPLEEQTRIATEVERQLSFIEACERAVDVGLARSEGLRRSVLKAAFEGRLVPQDPSDEPASVLLDRIRAERSQRPVAKRRSRQTA